MSTETEGLSGLRVELEHPLPEEIREMDRDDTVCKFCGVSYFIHHEIKQLQQEVRSNCFRLPPLVNEIFFLFVYVNKLSSCTFFNDNRLSALLA